jgi:hypothetical protein
MAIAWERELQTYGHGLSSRWLLPQVAVAAGIIAALVVLFLSNDNARALLAENGPIEAMTIMLHLACAALALVLFWRHGGLFGLIGFGALLFALREIDFHKRFTTFDVSRFEQYTSPLVPWDEKVTVVAALLAMAILAVWFAVHAWRILPRLRGTPVMTGLIALAVFLPFLKLLDSLPRNMRELGFPLDATTRLGALALEEISELALPVMIILLVCQLYSEVGKSAAAEATT